ncbi:DeoR/GlpR family DNA-binding transcription regulator [Lapillicoccus sp.]|uniref:DeoR/GlpR family DNA-binding transcription regulator n=1 Tax=Lapillicoccus sp. TaxID=1909287 RepID=UPI0032670AD8
MADQQGRAETLRYDSAPARRRRILTAVAEAGFISVTDLARQLGVSDMTVRRDLRKLEHQSKVRVVHGGVSALLASLHSPAFAGRAGLQSEGKRTIAERAVGSIPWAATIAVDAGTTTYAVAQALPDSFTGTVVTHSVPVMQLLLTRGLGRVVGLGGDLLRESQAFVGPRTVEATQGLRVQTLFLGAAAVDHKGLYVSTDSERPTKLALMDIADRVVLLVDNAKFSSPAAVLLCGWDRIAEVVTDLPPADAIRERLTEMGVSLEVALAREPARAETP